MFLSHTNQADDIILIVDDTPQHALELMELVSDYGKVHFSESAADAFTLIEHNPPDLILLDIDMPDMNGWDMCRILKQDPRFQDIPVIFITGHDEPDLELFSLAVGGLDFIQKPFNPKVCQLRVRNQLELRRQQRLIEQGQEQLRALVNQVPVHITYWDEEWHNLYSNDYFEAWTASAEKRHISQILPSKLSAEIQQRSLSETEQSYTMQLRVGDDERHYQVHQSHKVEPLNFNSHLVTIIDLTEIQQAKKALFSEKERLRVTLNSIGDGVVATNNQGQVTFMNAVAERMTGWRWQEARKQNVESVMRLRDANTKLTINNPLHLAIKEQRAVSLVLSSELLSKAGSVYAIEDSSAPIRNEHGEIIGGIMVFHDVSASMAMANKMSQVVNHDSLTGLPNRVLLQEKLAYTCEAAGSRRSKVAVLLIDIDNFKYLNDSLGHQYGDELICLMARRLEKLIPSSGILARVGGDEFVVLMANMPYPDVVKKLAAKLLTAMHEPFKLADQQFNVSVSMGVSLYPDDAKDSEQLMRHADVAMYRAKQEGRNRYNFFSTELEIMLLQRNQLEKRLREALKQEDIIVHYQPKFCLETQKIIGAEALVRLKDESGDMIAPGQFIGLAEESGLILELGKQVLEKACQAASRWLSLGFSIPVSVNVAAAQFSEETLANSVSSILSKHRVPAQMLELEITETSLMENVENTQCKLKQLKEIGVKISIDDFGTGYSSLAYLKKFDIDVMKIDMSFVADMLNNRHDYEIVKTIISLGQSMELELIAEGVEELAQSQALISLGCEAGQGYLFSKPVELDALLNLLSYKSDNRNTV